MSQYRSFSSFLALLTVCFLASCRNVMPGNFWSRLHTDYIIQNISDQGPRGGHREIFWESKKPATFSATEIIQFAQTHGWKFVDSSYNYSGLSKTWHVFNTREASPPFQNTYFDKWAKTDWKLLQFDSKWTRESEAGSGEFVTSYGYILLNNERNMMMFIHVWGE